MNFIIFPPQGPSHVYISRCADPSITPSRPQSSELAHDPSKNQIFYIVFLFYYIGNYVQTKWPCPTDKVSKVPNKPTLIQYEYLFQTFLFVEYTCEEHDFFTGGGHILLLLGRVLFHLKFNEIFYISKNWHDENAVK